MPDARFPALARLAALLMLPLVLAACVAGPGPWASDEEVRRAVHSDGGPPEITLYTVVDSRTNAGDHSSLVINGEHRILYDPAGTWFNRHAARRNDVHYGMTRQLEQFYLGYHARETHHVVAQTVRVTPEQAAAALRAAERLPRAGPGQCAMRTGSILRQVPGFEGVSRSWFPRSVMESFGRIPGVETRRIDAEDVAYTPAPSTSPLDDAIAATE